MNPVRHFLDISELGEPHLRAMLESAHDLKRRWHENDRPRPLLDKVLATIFEKPSTRTRVSFDVAMRQLGGHVINLAPGDMQLGRGESVADTARVLSRYVDAIMIRTTDHAKMLDLASHATVPVINGLTDRTHPSQLMADVMTVEEHLGPISERTVAWAGDGNNMACSWIHAAARFGFELRIACPPRYRPPGEVVDWALAHDASVHIVDTLDEALRDADCVVTDTWVSMSDARARTGDIDTTALEAFRIDARAMALARDNAIFMHCMPMYRGREVSADVADGPQSVVFDEAENRLHAQKAILEWCMT